jgi:hypothetical protein
LEAFKLGYSNRLGGLTEKGPAKTGWPSRWKDACRTEDHSFDLTAFKACLKENGIEPPKVDMERHGAIGRFRMCAGLMLRRQAAKAGFVVIGGRKIQAPGAKKRGRKTKTAEAGGASR